MHRDLYLSDELLRARAAHFFANTWNYVGHASQVPTAGDYVAVEIAGRPLLMVRQPRRRACACSTTAARTRARSWSATRRGNVGKFFRCPYHAWTYQLDGSPLGVPLKSGYEGTR